MLTLSIFSKPQTHPGWLQDKHDTRLVHLASHPSAEVPCSYAVDQMDIHQCPTSTIPSYTCQRFCPWRDKAIEDHDQNNLWPWSAGRSTRLEVSGGPESEALLSTRDCHDEPQTWSRALVLITANGLHHRAARPGRMLLRKPLNERALSTPKWQPMWNNMAGKPRFAQ